MESEGHAQTVEDFLLPEGPLHVTLPSGLEAVLDPVNRLEFFAEMGWLPGQLANAVAGEAPGEMSIERALETTYRMLCRVFISPKFSLTPGPGEYHPRRLGDADRMAVDQMVAKWTGLGGALDSVKSFRDGEPGTLPAPGASGGEIRPTAERDTGDSSGKPASVGD